MLTACAKSDGGPGRIDAEHIGDTSTLQITQPYSGKVGSGRANSRLIPQTTMVFPIFISEDDAQDLI